MPDQASDLLMEVCLTGFLIDPTRLAELAASRMGRAALSGFEYQRAFALLRLVSMVTGQGVIGCRSHPPHLIRYEWAEDIDELDAEGRVTLWQCKNSDGWTAASTFFELFISFAPKWLWTPEEEREHLRLRLVTSDAGYATFRDGPGKPLPPKADVRKYFVRALNVIPKPKTDRALWQDAAEKFGPAALFDEMWDATRVLYVSGAPAPGPHGFWVAEDDAISVLAKSDCLAAHTNYRDVVQSLHALLSTAPMDVDAQGKVARPLSSPISLRPVDVADRLQAFAYRATPLAVPFRLIDPTQLRIYQSRPRGKPYVARRPEWEDVVHGADAGIGFFERSMTQEVFESMRDALVRSNSNPGQLQLQWLVGTPGSGKSTLALRVAAQLLGAGVCSVIDARFGISEDDDADAIAKDLYSQANSQRPLLLLLDNPLGVGSCWPAVLTKLSRFLPNIVVLAATPTLLLSEHEHELKGVQLLPNKPVARLDQAERDALAALYPDVRMADLSSGDEELLVLSMQVAANSSFDNIIDGVWNTLARGQALPGNTRGRNLPWQAAAFWLVVFFHRAGGSFPMSLLQAILTDRAGGNEDFSEELACMTDAHGWQIFQIDPPPPRFAFQGNTLRTMHTVFATAAWNRRPARNWSVDDLIAKASLRNPESSRVFAQALSVLHAVKDDAVRPLLSAVTLIWCNADKSALETRNLYQFFSMLYRNGVPLPKEVNAAFVRRVEQCDGQSWLAALQLIFMSSTPSSSSKSVDLPYLQLIEQADFSVAPGRALSFLNTISDQPQLRSQFIARLWSVLDESAGMTLSNVLLSWLLIHCVRTETQAHAPGIRAWLTRHPEDIPVRQVFLGHLLELSESDQSSVFSEYRTWLAAHPEDTTVRLTFLEGLRKRGEADQIATLNEYRAWLATHPDDTNVRCAFVRYLTCLNEPDRTGAFEEQLAWLAQRPSDTNVRTALLTFMRLEKREGLAALLEDVLGVLGHGTPSFQPGSASLAAVATLSNGHLPLMVRWMYWAANVLDAFHEKTSPSGISMAVRGLINQASAHAAGLHELSEEKVSVQTAIDRLECSLKNWRISVGRYTEYVH